MEVAEGNVTDNACEILHEVMVLITIYCIGSLSKRLIISLEHNRRYASLWLPKSGVVQIM
jgi:hypothetical protein